MVAEVIINTIAKELNRTYDYIIPDSILNQIKIGSRVFVPFGRAKQKEGFVVGIKKESEEYIQAIDLLNNNGLPIHILCDHELNQDYLRLEVPSEGRIKDISLIKSSNTADGLKIIKTPLTDKQCEVLQTIYKMCANNTQSQQIVKENFGKKIKEYNNLCIIKDWWNSISSAFQITAVGRVLAHSNAKRIDNTLPDMD